MRVLGTGKKKGGKKWENLLGSQLRTLSSSQPPRRLVQVPRCVAVNFGPMGLPMVFEKTILEILRYCQQKTLEVVKWIHNNDGLVTLAVFLFLFFCRLYINITSGAKTHDVFSSCIYTKDFLFEVRRRKWPIWCLMGRCTQANKEVITGFFFGFLEPLGFE